MAEVLVQDDGTGHQGFVDPAAKAFYAQATDPGAVGAGAVWKNTATFNWWERNSGNDGWDSVVSVAVSAVGDAGATATRSAESAGAGPADAGTIAATYGAGGANVAIIANAIDGYADAHADAISVTGTATAGSLATRDGVSAGMQAVVDGTSARMSFNGVALIARPELPATPTEQDIATVLVNLGLVTQAAP